MVGLEMNSPFLFVTLSKLMRPGHASSWEDKFQLVRFLPLTSKPANLVVGSVEEEEETNKLGGW